MTVGASFDSTKTPLHELLGRADNGKLQLPDFQREWVWDDERIRSLLASVSVSFPIGAVMLLETRKKRIEKGWRNRRGAGSIRGWCAELIRQRGERHSACIPASLVGEISDVLPVIRFPQFAQVPLKVRGEHAGQRLMLAGQGRGRVFRQDDVQGLLVG